MRRILFVDDEHNVLQGLQRLLRPLRHEWDMAFVQSAAEALSVLAQQRYDVIVSDARMPGMSGAELLASVAKQHPHMVRIVLSGQSDEQHLLRAIGPAHQYLSKPCDPDALRDAIARACELRGILSSGPLLQLVSQIESLPSLPTHYAALLQSCTSSDTSLNEIADLIGHDAGMTAKILQLSNSAYFGQRRRISSPVQAVALLGLNTVKALVSAFHAFTQFDVTQVGPLFLDTLWLHTVAVADLAKHIARDRQAEQRAIDDAYAAGLLHDAGQLVLAANLPERYAAILARARCERIRLVDAEHEALGTTHAEVGAYLMGLWGLPDTIVNAIAMHHCPSACHGNDCEVLAAVHVADALAWETSPSDVTERPQLDSTFLARMGIDGDLSAWKGQARRAFDVRTSP